MATAWLFASACDAQAAPETRDAPRASDESAPRRPDRASARAALERTAATPGAGPAAAEAICQLGDLDEEDGAFARALARDEECARAAGETSAAAHAAERAAWLDARSEGGFVPLARLERVRREPDRADDPAEIDALARDLETFPAGRVRSEARMVVAEAWLGRMRDPPRAIVELRRVVSDPDALELTARLAERELVEALAATGAIAGAAAEAHARAAWLDRDFVRSIDRLVRRRWARLAAAGVLAVFAVSVAVALGRALARRSLGGALRALGRAAPASAAFVAFVAGAGALLASLYEAGNASPFLLLGAAVLPLVLVARAWGAVGSERTASRIGRCALCAATVLAAAFVVLDAVNPAYLEGFGL